MPFVPPARHLLRAKDLADARYTEPLGVEDMARAAGLSKAHFSREFKQAFGESPYAYLLTRRLERAATLLRVTTVQSRTCACRLGFRASARSPLPSSACSGSRRRPTAQPFRRRPPTRACRRAWSTPTAVRNTARFEKTALQRRTSVAA